mgnify:FL=1
MHVRHGISYMNHRNQALAKFITLLQGLSFGKICVTSNPLTYLLTPYQIKIEMVEFLCVKKLHMHSILAGHISFDI